MTVCEQRPLVSIGMPVYNGELTLRSTLEAILRQEFDSFEVNICDNGSTDGTRDICLEYVARDNRVYYYPSDKNMGAGANFNRAFRLCHSKYFMFASDDDLREPDYLTKCVKALEDNPEAVLCSTFFNLIEVDGNDSRVIDDNMDTVGLGQFARVHRVLTRLVWASAIYGVIRSEAMARTTLFRNIFAADFVLLVQLASMGSFVKVREVLYHRKLAEDEARSRREYWNRHHPDNIHRRLFLPATWMIWELLLFVMGLEVTVPHKLRLSAEVTYQLFLRFGPPDRAVYHMSRRFGSNNKVTGPVVKFVKRKAATVRRDNNAAR